MSPFQAGEVALSFLEPNDACSPWLARCFSPVLHSPVKPKPTAGGSGCRTAPGGSGLPTQCWPGGGWCNPGVSGAPNPARLVPDVKHPLPGRSAGRAPAALAAAGEFVPAVGGRPKSSRHPKRERGREQRGEGERWVNTQGLGGAGGAHPGFEHHPGAAAGIPPRCKTHTHTGFSGCSGVARGKSISPLAGGYRGGRAAGPGGAAGSGGRCACPGTGRERPLLARRGGDAPWGWDMGGGSVGPGGVLQPRGWRNRGSAPGGAPGGVTLHAHPGWNSYGVGGGGGARGGWGGGWCLETGGR